jgi:hypothetical protein
MACCCCCCCCHFCCYGLLLFVFASRVFGHGIVFSCLLKGPLYCHYLKILIPCWELSWRPYRFLLSKIIILIVAFSYYTRVRSLWYEARPVSFCPIHLFDYPYPFYWSFLLILSFSVPSIWEVLPDARNPSFFHQYHQPYFEYLCLKHWFSFFHHSIQYCIICILSASCSYHS